MAGSRFLAGEIWRMAQRTAIIMAAGKGTRMKSELPKVLVEVLGRPMIEYVLDSLDAAGISRTAVVVGYRSDLVRQTLAGRKQVAFVEQTEQRGTGHAVMVCREELATVDGPILIVAGDSPMLRSDSVQKLFAEFDQSRPACLMGTTHKPDPTGLGRIMRGAQGEFVGIVEEKDATPEQRRITEVNLSCYVFNAKDLWFALDRIKNNNAQGEFYLTDCPGVLKAAGKDVRALPVLQPSEALSINTREELAQVEAALQADV
jgi:bifunctional UDP-N-acetylglucosamine pyrophosphorylase/glucosamine-1-phosphate N-acetyltransferase/UDP-N-acetylglucosamine pyrophosphorylase